MPRELAEKKLEQIAGLLAELGEILKRSKHDFLSNTLAIRAAERNFQLVVDLAADLNAHILLGRGEPAPDTYRQSFIQLGRSGILSMELAAELAVSARLRNILVHEYDFEEDFSRFYEEAKRFAVAYESYLAAVRNILRET